MKKIFIFLLFVSTVAFGQTYPSPTFVAVNGNPIYTPNQFFAACNGSTNDATAIQNAINAAQTAGGGVINFQQGKTCAVSSTQRRV